jgi:ATP-grasp domain, R2K clade family 3
LLEINPDSLDLFLLEDTVWIACAETGIPSYDFPFDRFFFRGDCVGAGPYWADFSSYKWKRTEEQEAMALAHEVAMRVGAPFLVVDVAQTAEGEWIAIECNDGQESGYSGVPPIGLWNNLINLERGTSTI